jgi:hypothetical protein
MLVLVGQVAEEVFEVASEVVPVGLVVVDLAGAVSVGAAASRVVVGTTPISIKTILALTRQ